MSDDPQPLVSVVSVNHNGAHLLPGLLDALRLQTYDHREVVLVDNGSTDGSVELVQRDYPEVRVLRRTDNSGFVGGNNDGIRAAGGELIALANNDTVPEPTWLEALVRTLLQDPGLAAVGSKLLFLRPYVRVRLRLETETPQTAGVEAALLVGEESAFAGCDYLKPVFRDGFGAAEVREGRRVRRSRGDACVDLPVPRAGGAGRLDLALTALRPSRVWVEVGGRDITSLEVDGGPAIHRVEVPAAVREETAFDLINNAGTALSPDGDAADRGIYQPDRGQYDREEELEAICGAAVLLRRSALDRVGLFDRDFFMYYEDTDLSWRLRRAGYRLRYQPRSRIRHVHAASSVEWSPLFTFYTARNKLLLIAKNGGAAALLRAYAGELRCMISLLVRSWRARGGPQAAQVRRELVTRLRIQASLVKQIPRAWLKRTGVIPH